MGRLLLLLFVIAVFVVLWMAFRPATWRSAAPSQPPAIKGPDDDEDFLWQIEKERFKQRRAQEKQQRDKPEED